VKVSLTLKKFSVNLKGIFFRQMKGRSLLLLSGKFLNRTKTDTGSCAHYAKMIEKIILKELGKMAS